MCGRYEAGLSELDLEDYRQAIKEIESLITVESPVREAFPSQELPIITSSGLTTSHWGYPLDKKLIINARSESITTRPLFSKAIQHNRCLIPAKAYFEWKQSKVKYQVEMETPMTMAGLRLASPEGDRFVIITAEANEQIQAIHHRMPVLLTLDQLSDYLFDTEKALKMLQPYMGKLHLNALTPEQLSLFD